MPKKKDSSIGVLIRYTSLVIVIAVLSGLSYYLSIYSKKVDKVDKPVSKKEASLNEDEGIIPDEDISKSYPNDTDLPEFIAIEYFEVPESTGFKYKHSEDIGVRVFSTGVFTTTTVMNGTGSEELGEALELEVIVDDKEDYLIKSDPFKITLSITYDRNFSRKPKRLLFEGSENMTQVEIEEMFVEGSQWVVVPYTKTDYYAHILDSEDVESGDFLNFLDEHYNGSDSGFMDKVFLKNVSEIQSPLIVTRIYQDKVTLE